MYLFLDYETRSKLPIKKTGGRRYAQEAEVLMAAWFFSEDPAPPPPAEYEVQQWDRYSAPLPPAELMEAMHSPEVTKSAFNAPFEIEISRNCFNTPIYLEQWRCTMAWAYARAFTGRLGDVGLALGLPASLVKDPIGGKLIQRFCVPRKPSRDNPREFFELNDEDDAGRWNQFLFYNRQDVVAEIAIAHELRAHPLTPAEQALWVWDRKVNDRGLPIDVTFAEKAAGIVGEAAERYLDEIAYITGLLNPNSRDQVLKWLQARGVKIDNLRAETLEGML